MSSKPSSWLLNFHSVAEKSYAASVEKLKELFRENGSWIEGEQVRLEKEREAAALMAENERKAKLLEEEKARLKTLSKVKKTRGRPKKSKLTMEETVMLVNDASPSDNLSVDVDKILMGSEELVKQAENRKPRGRTKKTKKDTSKTIKMSAQPKEELTISFDSVPNVTDDPRSVPDQEPSESHSQRNSIRLLSLPFTPSKSISEPEELAFENSESKSDIPKEAEEKEPIVAAAVLDTPRQNTKTPVRISEVANITSAKNQKPDDLCIEIMNPPDSILRPRQKSIIPIIASPMPAPRQEIGNVATPKVESWTSQFLKTAPAESVEATKNSEVAATVEAPSEESRQSSSLPMHEAVPKAKANPMISSIISESQPSVESPLTRARRIDSQNTWREQQLSKFFVSKKEVLRSAMHTLKTVKSEERASKMMAEEKIRSSEMLADQAEMAALEDNPFEGPSRNDSSFPKRISEETDMKQPEAIPQTAAIPAETIRHISHESPLRMAQEPMLLGSGPASPSFLSATETPLLDNTMIPDEEIKEETIITAKKDEPKTSEVFEAKSSGVFETKIPTKRGPSQIISEEERIKRQRLKERQQQAIEKRNAQLKRAQDAKAKQEELFNPKPRPPMPVKPAAAVPRPTQPSSRPTLGSSMNSLHKTAVFNASKANLSHGGDKPDFKTPAAKIRSPAPIKMAEKVVSSPVLPDIPSGDEEEYLRKASDGKGRPDWANTPALKAAIMEQQSIPSEKIFDKIQPVRLEDIFKNKTFKRGRNSTIPFM